MPTSDDIADLKHDLAKIEAQLEAKVEILENRQDTAIGSIKETTDVFQQEYTPLIKSLQSEVARVSKLADRPWYRVPAFWAGLSAVPALVIGGWIIKAAFQEPALLRLIHKGFGTEIVLSEAMKDNEAQLTKDIETALAERIEPGQIKLSEAITAEAGKSFLKLDQAEAVLADKVSPGKTSLKEAVTDEIAASFLQQDQAEKFLAGKISPGSENIPSAIDDGVLKHENFAALLSRTVDTKLPTLHLSLLDIGLIDPKKLFEYNGGQNQDTGRLDEVTTVFSALPGQKVRINVGLFTTRVNMEKVAEFNAAIDEAEKNQLFDQIYDENYKPRFNEILSARIGANDIMFRDDRLSYTHTIGGRDLDFASYTSDPVPVKALTGAKDFPLQTLSFELTSTEDFFAQIIVIVERLNDGEEDL